MDPEDSAEDDAVMWELKPAKLTEGIFYCNGCGRDLHIRIISDGVNRGEIAVVEVYASVWHEKLGQPVLRIKSKYAREAAKRGKRPKRRRPHVIPQPDGSGWHIGDAILSGTSCLEIECVCSRVQVIQKKGWTGEARGGNLEKTG